jgi:hypothetical protein
MANLLSLSRTHGSARGVDAVNIALANSPLLRAINAMSGFEQDATDFFFDAIEQASDITARTPGSGATAPTHDMGTITRTAGALRAYSDGVDIDISYLADVEIGKNGINNQIDKKIKTKLKNFFRGLEIKIAAAQGGGSEMKGLSKILDGTTTLPGFTDTTRVINAKDYSKKDTTPTSLDISIATTNYDKNINYFLEMLYTARNSMDTSMPMFMYAPEAIAARVQTIARNENTLTTDINNFGVPVQMWNGIPIITCVSGAIPVNESDDKATTPNTDTTSIYFISPGEMRTSLVTNSGVEYFEFPYLEAKTSGREYWETRLAWKIEEPKSILRIRNIKV